MKKKEDELKRPEIVKLVGRVASVEAGLTQEEIKNIYSREQSIVTMYSPARSFEGRDMFTHWVVLQHNEFNQLHNLLHKLCEKMGEQDARNPVMTALREFSEMYSHEDFTGLTVGDVLSKRLGIPNLEQTDFSGRTSEEIDDAYRAWQSGAATETWENWHLRACKADAFTQYMEDGKKVSPDAIECDPADNTCAVPEKKQRKFRWSVQVSQDSPTYYVPLDILP